MIFVDALGYKGPSYEHPEVSERERRILGYRGIFPVLPVERSWNVKNVEITRRMMPLELGWARSIHKSQGCTAGPEKPIPRYLLDIGNVELSAGLSYVGASRATGPTVYAVANTEAGYAFPTEKRFNNIGADGANKKKEIDLRLRRQESARLLRLANSTVRRHAELFAYCENEVAALAAAAATQSEAQAEAQPEAAVRCPCDVLSTWAKCPRCKQREDATAGTREAWFGGDLVRCHKCGTVRCTAACGYVLFNTPEEPFGFAGQTPMEEDSDDGSTWEKDEPMERADVDMLESEEPPESPMEVEFDLEDCQTFDQLDDEMFPRKIFERDAASDGDASEVSFASVRAEEGAESDIELFEEPPPGAQFRY